MEEIKKIETESQDLVVRANDYMITNQVIYEGTADFLRNVKELKKKIGETFDPIVNKAHQAHKEAKAQQKKHLEPIEEAEKIVKRKIRVYEDEKERERLAAEAKARKEVEEKERKERERLEAKAEKAIEKGDDAKAEELLEKAEEVNHAPAPVARTIDRQKGLGIRRNWKFRILSVDKIPRKYMEPDKIKIGQIVRAEGKDCDIPGIEIYQD